MTTTRTVDPRLGYLVEACHVAGRFHETACAKHSAQAADDLAESMAAFLTPGADGRSFLEGLMRDLGVNPTLNMGPRLGARNVALSEYLDAHAAELRLSDGTPVVLSRREYLECWLVLSGKPWTGACPHAQAMLAMRQQRAAEGGPTSLLRSFSRSILNYAYRLLDESYREAEA